MSLFITIEGTQYICGTRIPVQKIRDIYLKDMMDRGMIEDVYADVEEYSKSLGYRLTEDQVKRIIEEATSI